MVDICLGNTKPSLFGWATAYAGAFLFYRGEVPCERLVAKIDNPSGDDSVAKALLRWENQYSLKV